MEPDRLDDVAFRMIEEPAPLPPRARLRRRVALVLTSAIVAAGGMAAGADALTGSAEQGAPPAAKSSQFIRDSDGRRGHDCPAGKGHGFRKHRNDSSSTLSY